MVLFGLSKREKTTMKDWVAYRDICFFLFCLLLTSWKPINPSDNYAKVMLNSYVKMGGAGGFKALENYLKQPNGVNFELLKLPESVSQPDSDWWKGLYDKDARNRLVPKLRKAVTSIQNQEVVEIYSKHICDLETLYDRTSETGACTMQQEQELNEYRVTWIFRVLDILCALGAFSFHLIIKKQKFNNKSGAVNE